MPETRRPTVYAVWLIIAGVVGWYAAYALTMERLHTLANPEASLGCDFSVLVQCKVNLESWQGSVFGFPNPILGLTGWMAPIVVGAALLAGARFAKWFWFLFWLGILGAQVFVIWLISQSIYDLGTLCPWCMVTWSVTFPTFYATTLHLARIGVFPSSERVRELANRSMPWVPLLTLLTFFVIAVLAQLRLNVIATLV